MADPRRPETRSTVSGRRAYAWHWRIGLAAGLFVVALAATGILLNHSDRLGLDRTHVGAPWLLDWYGISPRSEPVSYRLGDRWLTWLGGRLYLDGRRVDAELAEITGALRLDDMIAVAGSGSMVLLTPAGARIERLTAASLPGRIEAMGRGADGELVVRTPSGRFAADQALARWRRTGAGPVSWAAPGTPPELIHDRVLAAYRGQGLSWERVILDLHSGRILGTWGPYFMDAAALALLVLAGTGLYNRFSNGRRGQR